MNHAAKAHQVNYTKELPTVVCVDEFHYAKHHYSFEMIDGRTSELIELFSNRASTNIRKYLSNYTLTNRQRVEYVVTDMNTNYGPPKADVSQCQNNYSSFPYYSTGNENYAIHKNHYPTSH